MGYGLPGEISTSVEAYLALRLLGVPSDNAAMQRARQFIVGIGGIPKVRVFVSLQHEISGTLAPEFGSRLIATGVNLSNIDTHLSRNVRSLPMERSSTATT